MPVSDSDRRMSALSDAVVTMYQDEVVAAGARSLRTSG